MGLANTEAVLPVLTFDRRYIVVVSEFHLAHFHRMLSLHLNRLVFMDAIVRVADGASA